MGAVEDSLQQPSRDVVERKVTNGIWVPHLPCSEHGRFSLHTLETNNKCRHVMVSVVEPSLPRTLLFYFFGNPEVTEGSIERGGEFLGKYARFSIERIRITPHHLRLE